MPSYSQRRYIALGRCSRGLKAKVCSEWCLQEDSLCMIKKAHIDLEYWHRAISSVADTRQSSTDAFTNSNRSEMLRAERTFAISLSRCLAVSLY